MKFDTPHGPCMLMAEDEDDGVRRSRPATPEDIASVIRDATATVRMNIVKQFYPALATERDEALVALETARAERDQATARASDEGLTRASAERALARVTAERDGARGDVDRTAESLRRVTTERDSLRVDLKAYQDRLRDVETDRDETRRAKSDALRCLRYEREVNEDLRAGVARVTAERDALRAATAGALPLTSGARWDRGTVIESEGAWTSLGQSDPAGYGPLVYCKSPDGLDVPWLQNVLAIARRRGLV